MVSAALNKTSTPLVSLGKGTLKVHTLNLISHFLAAQTNTSLLALTSLSLLIPAAFSATSAKTTESNSGIINLSHGTAIILLVVYALYLVFQLKTHSALVCNTTKFFI